MSTYEISKSSLLSLKAEILKKQEEVNKAKLENKTRIQREVKKGPLELKNKGIESRLANDISEEDQDLLTKSRSALEAKAKLYDKLSKGSRNEEEREHNSRYLVHFDKKSRNEKSKPIPIDDDEDDYDHYPEKEDVNVNYDDYKAENSDDEWVEYIDCLGRTRTCLKKDLAFVKEKDINLRPTVETRAPERRDEDSDASKSPDRSRERDSDDDEAELLSKDMRKELQRRKWEQEEEDLRNKNDMHYQDILFNEARSHGVGYYGFSKDEEERAKQQEALKKLRQETQEQQKVAQSIKKNREKQLKTRIRAAQNRKRARMGLPSLTSDDEEEKPENTIEEPIITKISDEELKEQKVRETARKQHVRPWDIGKEGVKEHREYSQEEWVQIQRKKRDNEFAPPRSYNSTKVIEVSQEADKGLYFSSKKKEFSVDTSRPPPKVRNPSKLNKEKHRQKERPSIPIQDDDDSDVEQPRQKEFVPIPIKDESVDDAAHKKPKGRYVEEHRQKVFEPLDDDDDSDASVEDRLLADYQRVERRSVGAEIPPPATFDYYGPSSTKKRKPAPEKGNMEDSIMEGLKFLREKVEKKKTS